MFGTADDSAYHQAESLQCRDPNSSIWLWNMDNLQATRQTAKPLPYDLPAQTHIKWQDKVPDTEVLEQSGTMSVLTMLLKVQARWAGHVVRMPDQRLPKQILYGELWEGRRSVGEQKKRYKDSLKSTLRELQIDTDTWKNEAQDRSTWRQALHDGLLTAEENRIQKAKEARISRKTAASSLANALSCTQCGRLCKSKAGLCSHLRSHNP